MMNLKRTLDVSDPISNELNYNFDIKSNIILETKMSENFLIDLYPEKEYSKSKLIKTLHNKYDSKCKDLFYFRFTPKDSLNRFLLEQLSLKNSEKLDNLYDSNLSKPENIFELDTLEKEIRTVLSITSNLKSIENSRFKILRSIKECIFFSKQALGNSYYKIFHNENNLDNLLSQNEKLSDTELLNLYKKKREFYFENLKPILDNKFQQIKYYMYSELRMISVELKNLNNKFSVNKLNENVSVDFENDLVSIKYKETLFKLTKFHYKKLKKLYQSKEENFHNSLYCLINRYQTYFKNNEFINEGYGMQAALPCTVFNELTNLFEVTHEIFASPFNCFYSNYCSAFDDVDSHFGSSGSFFNFNPIEGSFECNPPFTEEVIERMADRIDILLEKSKQPLSFIVFIPEWLEPPTPGLVKMDKSKFMRSKFTAENGKHKFVSGSQYLNNNLNSNLYEAVHNTRVFFLQNDSGYKKWMPTQYKIDLLKNSMNACKNINTKKIKKA